jgi:hypothetical protein
MPWKHISALFFSTAVELKNISYCLHPIGYHNSLIPLHFYRVNIAIHALGKNKTHVSLRGECLMCLSIFNHIWTFWQIIIKASRIKFHKTVSSGGGVDAYGQTERWTDMMELTRRVLPVLHLKMKSIQK